MNAPERLPIANAPIIGARHLPCTLCMPSPSNPRYRPQDKAALVKSWKIDELAGSITHQGVIEPIIVRPRPEFVANGVLVAADDGVYEPVADKLNGEELYEIVAGERRWRATQIAGLPLIPVIVRNMTDFEVRAAQLVENAQRQDLHPIEEGAGYKNMLRQPGSTEGFTNVDDLAEHIGMSRRYVYNRIKLTELCDEARDAFYEGKITASVALLLARMDDPAQQAEATTEMVNGWGGEPFSQRSASAYLKKHYMLELGNATFDIADAYSVAGPCGQCTKRSGANPDLFEDITGGDMCQDSKCYQAKTAEAKTRALEAARQAGLTVVSGDDARKLYPYAHTTWANGHQFLSQQAHRFTDSDKTLAELLGDNPKGVIVVDHPDSDELVRLMPDDVVEKALKAKGLLRDHTGNRPAAKTELAANMPMNEKELARHTKVLAGPIFGQLAFNKLHEAIAGDAQLPTIALLLIVKQLARDMYYEALDVIYKAHGWPDSQNQERDFYDRLDRMSPRELANLAIELLVCDDCSNDGSDFEAMIEENEAPALLTIAKEYGVDLHALQGQAASEAAEQTLAEQLRREAMQAAAKKPKGTAAERKAKAASKHADGELTPEKALAAAVASSKGEGGAKKSTTKSKTKQPAAAAAKTNQTDEAASPQASSDESIASDGTTIAIGVKLATRPGLGNKTRTGTVDKVDGDRITLRWGTKSSQAGVYTPGELCAPETASGEFDGDAPIPLKNGTTLRPAAAWPFPKNHGQY